MSMIQSGFQTQFQPARTAKRKRLGNIPPPGTPGAAPLPGTGGIPFPQLQNPLARLFPNRFGQPTPAQTRTTTTRPISDPNDPFGQLTPQQRNILDVSATATGEE